MTSYYQSGSREDWEGSVCTGQKVKNSSSLKENRSFSSTEICGESYIFFFYLAGEVSLLSFIQSSSFRQEFIFSSNIIFPPDFHQAEPQFKSLEP